jgi:signal transduction histidine kinase/ActR/RegA family two-component response regulator
MKLIEALEARAALIYQDVAELPAGRRFAEVTLVPIGAAEGRITHLLAAWHDITAKQQAEEALREADRRKDEFLAMLAHELRNPLAPIRNVAHLLANQALDTATVRRSSELLQRQASQLARLVDDLLDVARITRGAIELKKEMLAVDRVLETALESVQPLFDVKQQTVRLKRSPEAVFVKADSVRLCQIFANLLSNAAKYSPDRTEVCVVVECTADEAIVTVRDPGRGIDPQMLPHLFELFMQGDRSLDRTEGGLGVGLTIVKHLVEMHGGQIRAHSAGLGKGSAFRVQLPRAFPAQSLPFNEPAERHPRRGGRRVLLVEDNLDAAESLALLLQMDGHTVEVANDGAAALATLERFTPEVILLDIGLPEMDGYLLAQTIRAKSPALAARLYAMTGYGRPEDRSLAQQAGFDDHLTKPVDPEQLLALIAASPRSVPASDS